jgi:hypothetical protein
VPAGWTVRESGGTAAVILTSPDKPGGVQPNLNVVVEPAPLQTALGDLAAMQQRPLASLRDFKVISEGPRMLADGRQAYAITFDQNSFDKPLRQRQLYVVAGDRLYLVTATASPQDFAAEEAHFDICFNSFRGGWR